MIKEVNIVSQYINATMKVLSRIYEAGLSPKNKTAVHHTVKDNEEWGYYINPHFGDVVAYMIEQNQQSILDLGAGAGHGIEILREMGFNVLGYENEQVLINENKLLLGKNVSTVLVKKDITMLRREDIAGFEVLYSWSPFKDMIQQMIFIEKLIDIMSEGQTFLCKLHRGILVHNKWKDYKSLKVYIK